MARDRGLNYAQEYLGIIEVIKPKLKKKKVIKILDAGCGWGIAMLDLVKMFGDKVDVFGFVLKPEHGNPKIMKKEAIKRHIFKREELRKIQLPKYFYCDANKRLPFKNNTFDIIYSMATVYLVEDKVKFFEECNRILSDKGGIARISPSFQFLDPKYVNKIKREGYPSFYSEYYEVWDRGREIKFWDYCKRIKGIKIVMHGGGNIKKNYLEIKKQRKLDFKLKLVASIDYNFIWEKWGGVKSIYTTQLKFKPKWK